MKTRLLLFIIAAFSLTLSAQKKAEPAKEGYNFTSVVSLKATPVKNQSSTGICWCFATTSFIESELLRMGKGEYDLSEMFIVRNNYIRRLRDNYLRRGNGNLGQGSLSHNWFKVFADEGIVPDQVYNGLGYGSPTHSHGELNAMLEAVAGVPVKRKVASPEYNEIVESILDIYLGEVPESFEYKGTRYTPKTFAESLGINASDYVEITSFSHFPFYTRGVLEVPDNWMHERFYNVPLNELIEIMDHALMNGYTVNWDGDVSEKGFSHTNGVAIVPDVVNTDNYSTTDRARFEKMPQADRLEEVFRFTRPYPEMVITQENRQTGYETFVTTDDHLMHLTGIVKDQNGTKYYVTKNSWGTERNRFGGYLNMSESFVKAKTIFIMVHKDAIPGPIRAKLGL